MTLLLNNGTKIIKLGRFICRCKMSNHCELQNIYGKEKFSLAKQCFKRNFCTAANSGKEINFDSITNEDKEAEHKLKVILLEAEVMRQEGKMVPDNTFLTPKHWKELINLPSRNARKKYFEYLFRLSKKKENRKAKQLEKKLQREEFQNTRVERTETFEEFALQYDLSHNNIFLRIYDTAINQMYNYRLIQSMMFGQKLVVDCGYEENMTTRENTNCAKQLMLLFGENRIHDDPFDLHFCNANPQGTLINHLHKHIPNLYEPSFPLNIHQGSYLDLFPKDQLVYLTPHCRQEMTEFDHNAIYIIGAIVDKINNEPVSLAKAKKEGLKMAKLPFDKYLQWGAGSGKSLTLNQVTSILNDVKFTRDWKFALRHVPKRKITEYNTGCFNKQLSRRNGKEKLWIPASNINFANLNYNNNKQNR